MTNKKEESKPNQKSDTLTSSVLSVGISVSSLSDGMFVLHVACEDNKQKVSLKIDYLLFIYLKCYKSEYMNCIGVTG